MHCGASVMNKMRNSRFSNRCKSLRTFTVTKEKAESVVADMAIAFGTVRHRLKQMVRRIPETERILASRKEKRKETNVC